MCSSASHSVGTGWPSISSRIEHDRLALEGGAGGDAEPLVAGGEPAGIVRVDRQQRADQRAIPALVLDSRVGEELLEAHRSALHADGQDHTPAATAGSRRDLMADTVG